jgi:predicted phosphodiesterase
MGELWVLDQLSAIAPVVAVHGNDDTVDAERELPYQQVIAVAGRRILLWHSHFPDWKEEMASRVHNDLRRGIQRSIDRGKSAGANIVVFGHWHIPLVHRASHANGDLLIINPGALASGNEFTRMLVNSVALLFIEVSGNVSVVHIDLSAPETKFEPQIDLDAGFSTVADAYARSILGPEVMPVVHFLRENLSRDEISAIRPLVAAKAMPLWESGVGELSLADVEDALLDITTLPPPIQARVAEVWNKWKSFTQL